MLAAGFGAAAAPADAAYTARISSGALRVTGNSASDLLALRLAPGAPGTLQVDVGDDGSADFSFDRALFDRIVVEAGGGDDTARMDESNGVFTNTESTEIRGEGGNDTLTGGGASERILGSSGDDVISGARGDDTDLFGAPVRTRSSGIPVTAATISPATAGPT